MVEIKDYDFCYQYLSSAYGFYSSQMCYLTSGIDGCGVSIKKCFFIFV